MLRWEYCSKRAIKFTCREAQIWKRCGWTILKYLEQYPIPWSSNSLNRRKMHYKACSSLVFGNKNHKERILGFVLFTMDQRKKIKKYNLFMLVFQGSWIRLLIAFLRYLIINAFFLQLLIELMMHTLKNWFIILRSNLKIWFWLSLAMKGIFVATDTTNDDFSILNTINYDCLIISVWMV